MLVDLHGGDMHDMRSRTNRDANIAGYYDLITRAENSMQEICM
jgi:hypothetical protein